MTSERLTNIRDFWNRKARENAYWYVSSYGDFERRDLSEFWASGRRIWTDLCEAGRYSRRRDHAVVEVGCGVGRLTRAIAAEAAAVYAVDISDEMLRIARDADLPNTHFLLGGSVALPVPSGIADLVVAYNVFQHLPSEAALRDSLAEMIRVAKPGGLLLFTLSIRTWRTRLLPVMRARRWVLDAVTRTGPRELHRREWTGIRPRPAEVDRIAPMPFTRSTLHGDKWLFAGSAPKEL